MKRKEPKLKITSFRDNGLAFSTQTIEHNNSTNEKIANEIYTLQTKWNECWKNKRHHTAKNSVLTRESEKQNIYDSNNLIPAFIEWFAHATFMVCSGDIYDDAKHSHKQCTNAATMNFVSARSPPSLLLSFSRLFYFPFILLYAKMKNIRNFTSATTTKNPSKLDEKCNILELVDCHTLCKIITK